MAAAVAAGPCIAVTGCGEPGPVALDRAAVIRRGLDFVLRHQDRRGAIPSEYYGVLRHGTSLAALAAWVISRQSQPERSRHRAALEQLLEFLRGVTVPGDAVLDYPNYTRAYYLRALAALGEHPEEQARIAADLGRFQFSAANGWSLDDLGYGGWGLGAEVPTKPFGTDFVNLSVTTAVIEALTEAKAWPSGASERAARSFVTSCYVATSGRVRGFVYSPGDHVYGGKAGRDDDGKAVVYAAPTADGMRALLALGQRSIPTSVEEARQWLAVRFGWRDASRPVLRQAFSASFPMEPALRYYTLASVAETARALGRPVLEHGLLESQRVDGSWSNPDSRMKEDDPVLATLLALRALSAME